MAKIFELGEGHKMYLEQRGLRINTSLVSVDGDTIATSEQEITVDVALAICQAYQKGKQAGMEIGARNARAEIKQALGISPEIGW